MSVRRLKRGVIIADYVLFCMSVCFESWMPLSAFYYTFWELLTRLERPIEAVLRTLLPLKCQSGSESVGTLSEFPSYYPANGCEYQTSQPWRLVSPTPYDLIRTPAYQKCSSLTLALRSLMPQKTSSKRLVSNPPLHKPHARSSLSMLLMKAIPSLLNVSGSTYERLEFNTMFCGVARS